ncbi:MAG TPA: hypothetical protein VFI90_17570 [Rubrobacter sp.]|nr:hypothetical protein [Rubrobacter sp.]
MLNPTEGPATVAILGGNPVIGKALESLLRSADYVARFFSEYPEEDIEPLRGASVVLILPARSSRHQESLITLIRDTPSTTNMPVIELITTPHENGNGQVTRVPWPCSIQDLRRSIDEKLLGNPKDTPEVRDTESQQLNYDFVRYDT